MRSSSLSGGNSPLNEKILVLGKPSQKPFLGKFSIRYLLKKSMGGVSIHEKMTYDEIQKKSCVNAVRRGKIDFPILRLCGLETTDESAISRVWKFLFIHLEGEIHYDIVKHALMLLPFTQGAWETWGGNVGALVRVNDTHCEKIRHRIATDLGIMLDAVHLSSTCIAFHDCRILVRRKAAEEFNPEKGK